LHLPFNRILGIRKFVNSKNVLSESTLQNVYIDSFKVSHKYPVNIFNLGIMRFKLMLCLVNLMLILLLYPMNYSDSTLNYKGGDFGPKLNLVPITISNTLVSTTKDTDTSKEDLTSQVDKAVVLFLIEDTRINLPMPNQY